MKNVLYLCKFVILESYLSIGPDMTIEFMPNPTGTPHLYGPASAFKLRYEFLDTMLGGAPLEPFSKVAGPKAMPQPAALLQTQSKSCNRVFRYSFHTIFFVCVED